MAVLPDPFDDDQRGVRRQLLEDLGAGALAVDEAVPLLLVDGVSAAHRPAEVRERGGQVCLQLLPRGPSGDVGGLAQVATGDGYTVPGTAADGVRGCGTA
ncbi:hypothetical protein [Streptomyces sp. NPDC055105]|uniref:hypothetical protein n=1 Tax=Streptomyces sp. NPDC055105 TaxID=3365719 RepID=UPI0037D76F0C